MEYLEELEKALFHKRQLSFGGAFKDIRKELKFEEKEDDLVHIDENKDEDTAEDVKQVVYIWNNTVHNYVNWVD